MKRIDVQIYYPESWQESTVWVDDNATESEIRKAVLKEALSTVEVYYKVHEEDFFSEAKI